VLPDNKIRKYKSKRFSSSGEKQSTVFNPENQIRPKETTPGFQRQEVRISGGRNGRSSADFFIQESIVSSGFAGF
jgi:hypothetical protein